MIIVKTPMRVSLFGGGSDIPAHFTEHGGSVVGMAIDKYCYTFFKKLPPFFEHKHRIVYRKIETVQRIEDIEHPLVRTMLLQASVKHGLEIMHNGDLSAKSGMGSSSAFAVGLAHAIAAHDGRMVTKKMLAETAIHVERELIPEAGGWQDQIWAAYGGLNRIDFTGNGFGVTPLILSRRMRNELVSSVVLFDTGLSRDASEIETDKEHRVVQNAHTLNEMAAMADKACQVLSQEGPNAMASLGGLLRDSWSMKKTLSADVTTPRIDELYAAGMAAGAYGGKLLGAGSGGFLMFLAPPEARRALRSAMDGLIEINVEVDYDGSKVVLYQPDGL